ncbi:hypothetical protein BO79DRAFT_241602 [Aspergillus costaricaensis CBS 115574]|uniref:Uncharacterized protein n=1 Tax=Aspergillus costaricaensis CBS 115574 TaxID=1448317 RepID=A0ACD1HXP4_9EURO|nr:hypothetical protein BO79DRAFT_241602 [Aspergillus costaricaensis CBS 115574]RAK82814.1 hypothetical protein BO79DRAFT_241602 [Aspergillus costaricaensis CBS 115574]
MDGEAVGRGNQQASEKRFTDSQKELSCAGTGNSSAQRASENGNLPKNVQNLFLQPAFTDQKEYRPNRTSSPPLRRSQGSWWMMAPRRTSTTTEGLFGYDTDTHTHTYNSPSSSSIPVGVIGPSGSINPPRKPILRLDTVFDVGCLACPLAIPPFLYAAIAHERAIAIINNSADRKAHLTQPAPEAKHSAGV